MVCPNSATCQCGEHADGLAAYARDRDAYLNAINALNAPKVTLQLVTPDPTTRCEHCGYRLDGVTHQDTCAQHRRREPHHATPRQPWQPRPARHRPIAA